MIGVMIRILLELFLLIIFGNFLCNAKTLYVIDIGHETPDVSMGEKLAVLSCQVRFDFKKQEKNEHRSTRKK